MIKEEASLIIIYKDNLIEMRFNYKNKKKKYQGICTKTIGPNLTMITLARKDSVVH